jgi:hypothetical protein
MVGWCFVDTEHTMAFEIMWRTRNGVAPDEKALNDSEGSFGTQSTKTAETTKSTKGATGAAFTRTARKEVCLAMTSDLVREICHLAPRTSPMVSPKRQSRARLRSIRLRDEVSVPLMAWDLQ